jgi:hypothetical protein
MTADDWRRAPDRQPGLGRGFNVPWVAIAKLDLSKLGLAELLGCAVAVARDAFDGCSFSSHFFERLIGFSRLSKSRRSIGTKMRLSI